MSSGFLPLLVSVLHADLSHAILDDIAPRTKFPPTATLGPDFIAEPTPFKNLSKRADHIPPNFCGWFSGSDYDGRWTYVDPSITCFWNSDAKFVGDAYPPQTACLEESEWSTWSCSEIGCSSRVGVCTGTRPYCATFTYGSDYRSFVCMSEKDVEYQLEPYWEGFSDPIAFPVYTGSSGISTGTQYPVGYFASVSSTRSDSDSGTSKDSGSTSSTTQGNTGSSSDHGGSSSPIGAIVGGVIGGLALISLIVGAIILFVGRGRRRRQGQHHQDSLGFQNGPESYARSPQPPSSTMSNVFPSYTAVPNTLPSEPPPESPPPQQVRYEIDTQYNQQELDNSRQYEDQADLGQQAELPGAQPLYPEYMSAAQRYSQEELNSNSGNTNARTQACFVAGGYQGVRGDVHEAP